MKNKKRPTLKADQQPHFKNTQFLRDFLILFLELAYTNYWLIVLYLSWEGGYNE